MEKKNINNNPNVLNSNIKNYHFITVLERVSKYIYIILRYVINHQFPLTFDSTFLINFIIF